MEFKYIIKAAGDIAFPVHSELNYFEFKEYIGDQCKKLHPQGHDVILKIGAKEYVNPEVMMVDDFVNHLPLLLGHKK